MEFILKHEQFFFPDTNGIKDAYGRMCMFHGSTLEYDNSFLPFTEENAHEYCSLLIEKGYNLIYWTLPWKAVEGSGAEQYSEEYLAGARRCLKVIEEYPIHVLLVPDRKIDSLPHWVLQTIGINPEKLADEDLKRYAFLTFKTLFFAGNCFTPDFSYEGESIQDFLQTRFTAAMKHSARRLKDCRAVIGFDTGNSAESGFIGTIIDNEYDLIIKASGFNPKKHTLSSGKLLEGESIFLEGLQCPWKSVGLWSVHNDKPVFHNNDFFTKSNSHELNFTSDFLQPFQSFFISELKHKHEHYLFIDKDSIPLSDEISPYPKFLCGSLIHMKYEFENNTFFEMEWESTACTADDSPCTELCIPLSWFPEGCKVERFDGTGTVNIEGDKGLAEIRTLTAQKCYIRIVKQ